MDLAQESDSVRDKNFFESETYISAYNKEAGLSVRTTSSAENTGWPFDGSLLNSAEQSTTASTPPSLKIIDVVSSSMSLS